MGWFGRWIADWIDIFNGAAGVLSFGLFRPKLDFSDDTWATLKNIERCEAAQGKRMRNKFAGRKPTPATPESEEDRWWMNDEN